MKEITTKLFFALLMVLCAISAKAYNFEVDGICYNINGSNVTVTYKSANYNSYSGDIVIPNTVTYNGTSYTVASIGDWAFYGCSGLTSVSIPNSVTSIGSSAFYCCYSLSSITIPNSVTSIGSKAFTLCRSMSSVTIGKSVTSIGDRAFGGCSGLTGIQVVNGNYVYDSRDNCNAIIKTSSNTLLWGCQNTTIPSSVTSIGNYAFENCTSLISVTIPNSITNIGNEAFSNCSGLTSVYIPNSVTKIGEKAFGGCSSLTCVTIGNSVYTIGDYAFYRCDSLETLNYNAVSCIDFPIKEQNRPFYRLNISTINIGDGVKKIPARFASGLAKLSSITIPNSVTNIGDNAFSECSGLTDVHIGNSVTTIGVAAFNKCNSITSIIIPILVTDIGSYAFSECSGLTSIQVIDGNSVYDSRDNCNAIIQTSSNKILWGCKNTTFPSSVSAIGFSAFRGCSGLSSINIPSSITFIDDYAFYGCIGLNNITIPNSIIAIGKYTFSGCSSLTSIIIPNSVLVINERAFGGCSSLTCVTIGNSVTKINKEAFKSCNELKTVLWNAVNCTTISSDAFNDITLTALQFGNGVQHIPANMPSLSMTGKALVLPNSVKTIETKAFTGNCDAVVIGDSIESIAARSFPSAISTAYVTATEPRPCGVGAFAEPETLYVPFGSGEKYSIVNGWNEFANIVEGEYVKATDIKLNDTTTVMPKSGTRQLTAIIIPSNASATSVTWLSLNPDVATVNNNGLVIAVNEGETNIVAIVDNMCDTCTVTVTPSISMDVNGDGEVNIADINAVIDMILSGRFSNTGDVNGDGEVNIADINAIIDKILTQ